MPCLLLKAILPSLVSSSRLCSQAAMYKVGSHTHPPPSSIISKHKSLQNKMENQPAPPTGRQWFRLASLARMQTMGQDRGPAAPTTPPPAPAVAPAPAPAPLIPPRSAPASTPAPAPTTTPPQPDQALVPRIPFPRPQAESIQAQFQPPRPSTPQPQQALLSSTTNGTPSAQPQPRSPPPKQQVTPLPVPTDSTQTPVSQVIQSPPQPSPRSRVPSRAPTPLGSPRVIKQSSPTPPESPKIPQLQPIKAPTPYPEPEPKPLQSPSPKHMQMQPGNSNGGLKTAADIKPKPLPNGNHSHIDARSPPPSREREITHNGAGTTTARKDNDGEMKIITMAGENMGAYMELGSVRRKQQHGHQLQNQTKGSEQQSEEEKSGDKKKGKAKKSAAEGKPTAALVNSNVQSVNNSILFRSSCIQQSPGVHFTLDSQRQPKHKGSSH